MRRKGTLQSRENAAHRAKLLAEIGRLLREELDGGQPLPDHLADLVRKIELEDRAASPENEFANKPGKKETAALMRG